MATRGVAQLGAGQDKRRTPPPTLTSSARSSEVCQDRRPHTRYNQYRRNSWGRRRWACRGKLGKGRGPGRYVSHEGCPVKRSEGGSDPLRIHEDLTLPTQTIIASRLRVGPRLLGFLLLAFP